MYCPNWGLPPSTTSRKEKQTIRNIIILFFNYMYLFMNCYIIINCMLDNIRLGDLQTLRVPSSPTSQYSRPYPHGTLVPTLMAYSSWYIHNGISLMAYPSLHIPHGISIMTYPPWHIIHGISLMAYPSWHIPHGITKSKQHAVARCDSCW